MKKEPKITLRLSADERLKIKRGAANCCMSVNQYIKYRVLGISSDGSSGGASVDDTSADDTSVSGTDISASEFFQKNFALLARVLISGYMHTRVLGLKHCSKEELEKIQENSEAEFRKLRIEKDGSES